MNDVARLVLSDEQLNHQIPQTFAAVLHSDPTWTEKIWTTIARKDGSLQVDFGLGKYVNLNVMDAFGGVSKGKRQWTVRGSRALFPDSEKSAVGPLAYSVLDPLKGVQFALTESAPLRFPSSSISKRPFLRSSKIAICNGAPPARGRSPTWSVIIRPVRLAAGFASRAKSIRSNRKSGSLSGIIRGVSVQVWVNHRRLSANQTATRLRADLIHREDFT